MHDEELVRRHEEYERLWEEQLETFLHMRNYEATIDVIGRLPNLVEVSVSSSGELYSPREVFPPGRSTHRGGQ
jgi:hypothetical protein